MHKYYIRLTESKRSLINGIHSLLCFLFLLFNLLCPAGGQRPPVQDRPPNALYATLPRNIFLLKYYFCSEKKHRYQLV